MPGRSEPSFQRLKEKPIRTLGPPILEMSAQLDAESQAEAPDDSRSNSLDPHKPSSPMDCTTGDTTGPESNKFVGDVDIKSASCWRRALDALLVARLEIYLALYLVARRMSATVIQDLLLQKSCLYKLAQNASVCSHLDDFVDVKDEAEQYASTTSMMRAVVLLAPSAVMAIFVGPWCDKYGYRTPLVSAMLGFMTSTLIDIFTVYHMATPLYVNILSMVPDGLCGGPISIFTAICSTATLSTREDRRRIKFFAISIAMSLAGPLGSYVGGQVYGRYGWTPVLFASLTLELLALVWTFAAIKSLAKPEHAKDGLSLRLKNFVQLKNLIESFKNAMKVRPNKGRLQLWCLLGATCCVIFDLSASGIAYYYVRKMYSWTVAYYSTVQYVSTVVGVALNVPIVFLFVKVLKISDPAMAVVGSCFAAAQMLILGLAFEEWLYYLQCLVGLPTFLGQVGMRTHLSKLVAPDEVGKVFSLLASFESVVPIIGEVLLTTIFNQSIGFLPGMPYLVAAAVTCIAVGLTSYVTRVHRHSIRYEEMSKSEISTGPIND
ncbi:putative peptidoglycan muropeptide transporter SLC46 isoform X1 [Rhipicephalus microplus]|uniref:putative peptidoglycan muropeptide transporter SLC46 isoform X1 n=2 Tax=Rhipicephalus microplus TaxID=6941 RepID=UPI003F6C27FA